jgi:hypothetical protein
MATDWRALIKMAAPVVGGLASDGPAQTGFQEGFMRGQMLAKQERERKQQLEQKQSAVGADYLLDVTSKAQQFDDPLQFAQFVDVAEEAGSRAGYIKPGDIKNRISFPESKTAAKRLKELTDQLAGLEKAGYNLDDLMQSGAVIRLGDKTEVPISAAMDLARKRPMDATGAAIPAPKKADAAASTDYGRALSRYAKGLGKTVDGLSFEDEQSFKKAFNQADDKPTKTDPASVGAQYEDLVALWKEGHPGKEPPAAIRTQLRAQANRVNDKPAAAKGDDSAADDAMVKAVMDNPALYDRLTAKEITAIAPKLAAAGFTFGKGLNESAVQKLSESRSAIGSLKDLRDVLKNNEQYIGPIAGYQAMNPWSPARKAQADIDRVKQRVGKALEGGVLRKEDEEKYKKILATLNDTPSTAIYKVDQLITTIEGDIKAFEDEQRRAGRRVISPKAEAHKDAPKAGPKIGERRTFNGKVGEWDGKGWKPVNP